MWLKTHLKNESQFSNLFGDLSIYTHLSNDAERGDSAKLSSEIFSAHSTTHQLGSWSANCKDTLRQVSYSKVKAGRLWSAEGTPRVANYVREPVVLAKFERFGLFQALYGSYLDSSTHS